MNRTDDTVRGERKLCVPNLSILYISTVPVQLLANPQLSLGDSSVSIVVTVSPSPPMSLDPLSILATIDPPHASAVLANYPTSSQQYMVMFTGLTSGTIYIYDIRVVLRNDNTSTTTIGLPVTGSFTVPGSYIPSTTCTLYVSICLSSACGTVCVTVVVVVSAVLLVVAVLSLAGGFGAYKYKNRTKGNDIVLRIFLTSINQFTQAHKHNLPASKDWSVRSFKSKNAEKHELA